MNQSQAERLISVLKGINSSLQEIAESIRNLEINR
jgi:hypothetical protein